jgi:hypothetical protein
VGHAGARRIPRERGEAREGLGFALRLEGLDVPHATIVSADEQHAHPVLEGSAAGAIGPGIGVAEKECIGLEREGVFDATREIGRELPLEPEVPQQLRRIACGPGREDPVIHERSGGAIAVASTSGSVDAVHAATERATATARLRFGPSGRLRA